MYRLVEPDELAIVDMHADVTELFRAAFTTRESVVLLTDGGQLAGYVYAGHLAKTFAPRKTTADYRLPIDSVTARPAAAGHPAGTPLTIIDVQRSVHAELLGRFSRPGWLQTVPVVDEAGRILALARRLKAGQDPDTLEIWSRLGQERGGTSAIAEFLRVGQGVATVAVWCDMGPLGELLVRELLDSDVRVTHILNDFAFLRADTVASTPTTALATANVDLVIVAGGSKSVPKVLRTLRPDLEVTTLASVLAAAHKWALGTRGLIEQATRLDARGIAMCVVSAPFLAAIKNPSPREQAIRQDWQTPLGTLLAADPAKWSYRLEPPTSDHYTLEEQRRLIVAEQPKTISRSGYTINCDTDNRYFHYKSGRRLVAGAPAIFRHTIWVVGDSSATNYYGDDSETIASYLQSLVNSRFGPELYQVADMACSFQTKEQTVRLVDDLELIPGDIVIVSSGHTLGAEFPRMAAAAGVPFRDLTYILDRPHEWGEVFVWSGRCHTNNRGQQAIAAELDRLLFGDATGVGSSALWPASEGTHTDAGRAQSELARSAETKEGVASASALKHPTYPQIRPLRGVIFRRWGTPPPGAADSGPTEYRDEPTNTGGFAGDPRTAPSGETRGLAVGHGGAGQGDHRPSCSPLDKEKQRSGDPTVRAGGVQRVVSSATTPLEYTAAVGEYLELLDTYRQPGGGRIGSIVMNCNPFTFGHRYLVEYASAHADRVYLFVVEEDLSVFPFVDRFALIQAGTADLTNVTVLPSGQFVVSGLTFPEYFSRSDNPQAIIDPTKDILLFADHVAPRLGITVRFAGEEPLDLVTRQYIAAQTRLLPAHGIEHEVIPRKETAGAPISASRVRALLATGDFDEIAKIVPPTTLSYLRERYGDPQ
ncbi:MAG: hypothetical protein LBI33_00165 [Propionibacteriaceae bacterium]|jgi:hypothetical protein|nr:hypothetical protein [Propionibacteriaceae bacterium]